MRAALFAWLDTARLLLSCLASRDSESRLFFLPDVQVLVKVDWKLSFDTHIDIIPLSLQFQCLYLSDMKKHKYIYFNSTLRVWRFTFQNKSPLTIWTLCGQNTGCKNNWCSYHNITYWFVDCRFKALSLAFQPSPSFFGARGDHIWCSCGGARDGCDSKTVAMSRRQPVTQVAPPLNRHKVKP